MIETTNQYYIYIFIIIIYVHNIICGGFNLPLWKIWISWDDDIPNVWINKIHVPNHQPVIQGSTPPVVNWL